MADSHRVTVFSRDVDGRTALHIAARIGIAIRGIYLVYTLYIYKYMYMCTCCHVRVCVVKEQDNIPRFLSGTVHCNCREYRAGESATGSGCSSDCHRPQRLHSSPPGVPKGPPGNSGKNDLHVYLLIGRAVCGFAHILFLISMPGNILGCSNAH